MAHFPSLSQGPLTSPRIMHALPCTRCRAHANPGLAVPRSALLPGGMHFQKAFYAALERVHAATPTPGSSKDTWGWERGSLAAERAHE